MAGSLSIPNTFATQSGNVPVSEIDTDLSTIATYVNAREIAVDVIGVRPAAGTAGRWFCATDVNGGTLYVDNGSSWVQVASGVTAVGGTLAVSGGGTGQVTLVSGSYLKGNGTSAITQQSTPLPVADLGSGSPSASNFLRGDGTWAVPASSSGVTVVNRTATPVTVAGTATETTIFSTQIDASSLSTDKRLRLVLALTWGRATTTGALRQFTLRFKYGATTVVTPTAVTIDNGGVTIGAGVPAVIEYLLSAAGSANAQIADVMIRGGALVAASAGNYESVVGQNVVRGTAAEDSTTNLNLVVTVQWNTGVDASATLTMEHAVLELL